jgi:hypothetical protein
MNFSPSSRLAPSALAAAALSAASLAWAQSTLDHLVVQAPSAPVTVRITQEGAGKLGTSVEPITLVSASSAPISLTVQQIGAFTVASQIKAYTAGATANTITLKQETADATPGAVNDVWAKLLLGTQSAPVASQHVTLLQTGDKAQATIESEGDNLAATIIQHGNSSGVSSLNIASNGASNTYGSTGAPITLGALSTLAISSAGDNNSYAISLAGDSTAGITNAGSFNTYNIATQLAGDSLALAISGSGNAFTFDFPTTGTGQYKAVAWGSAATPASVTSGNFVAQCGGSTCWVTDTSSNGYTAANLAAAANASVTPR